MREENEMPIAFDFELQPGRTASARFDLNRVCSMPPKISVITPLQSTPDHSILQFFNCMRGQTLPWFEWIIVCGETMPSPDREQLNCLAREDPRIQLRFVNDDMAAACNMAAAVAQAEYLCFYEA